MRRIGLQPDIIVIRGTRVLPAEAKEKIALFISVPLESVISDPDVESIYQVPRLLEREGVLRPIRNQFGLRTRLDMRTWNAVAERFVDHRISVRIAMVGKYANLADSYVSVNQALSQAGAVNGASTRISWIESEEIEKDETKLDLMDTYDGVVLPQGFGSRGVEGKIAAANKARVAEIPFLGLCYGFQLASVSFARHVLGLKGANTTEADPDTRYPVIDMLPEQRVVTDLGGTMRLGGHDVFIKKPSRAFDIYKTGKIRERHRHRYELNQQYLKSLEESGMKYTAFSDNGRRAEILELEGHPFYMATQYHPEYASRPERPEPIYVAFVAASVRRAKSVGKELEKVRPLSR